MNSFETVIEELNLDKSNWTIVKFGDVAIQQKGKVDRDNTTLTRYIKGEHMQSEDLHIRSWGELTDEYLGPAFHRKFEKGDILYGSRRTYLRKVALADFEGITSNTTFVIKANPKNILPKLLPFVMLSEGFSQHSIKNSKGSVNPYVNWKDLANYEFLLPPLEEQARLAELLWAMDAVVEKEKGVLERLEVNLHSQIEKEIHGIPTSGKTIKQLVEELSKKTKVEKLENLGEFVKGKGIPKSAVVEEGIPAIRYGELYTKHHYIIRKYYSHISEATSKKAFLLQKNDVLFAGSGETITEIGKSAAFIDNSVVYGGSDILIFRPKDMDGTYLGYLMNSQLVRQQLNKMGTGATVMHIYASDLKKLKIPIIALDKQKQIASKLEQIYSNIELTNVKVNQSESLQKSLINQIF